MPATSRMVSDFVVSCLQILVGHNGSQGRLHVVQFIFVRLASMLELPQFECSMPLGSDKLAIRFSELQCDSLDSNTI
jgi:hypothetical protein